MERIGLLGAAGAIGKSLATALNGEGYEYRVVGRNRESLQTAFGGAQRAGIATWNTDDAASMRASVRGLDTLVYLVGVPYDKFELHPVLMQKTIDAAVAEGVERIVLIGTVYPYGMPHTARVAESHPREPQTYKGKMRMSQEEALLTADAAGKIKGTILRLPDFYGPGVDKSFLHSIFNAAANGGKADMIGPIDTPHEFVYVPDVGSVVAALARTPEAYGKWWNLAGVGVTSQKQMMELAFSTAGRKPSYRVVGKGMLRVLGLFNPMLRELVEMHYLQTNPVLMDDSALQKLLGPIHKTPYAEGIERSVAALRK
jgi:nucleoside-diphosphate-sugar epimerase